MYTLEELDERLRNGETIEFKSSDAVTVRNGDKVRMSLNLTEQTASFEIVKEPVVSSIEGALKKKAGAHTRIGGEYLTYWIGDTLDRIPNDKKVKITIEQLGD